MVEYVSYNPPNGIKRKGEISRSGGFGWILCRNEEKLQFWFIHGGNWFLEDSLLLNPEETEAFEEMGNAFLDELYSRIVMKSNDFSSRFLERKAPEFIYISQVLSFDDDTKNLGFGYYYMGKLYTGSVYESDKGVVQQEWVLEEGEIVQYIKYGSDGNPSTILEGADSIIILDVDE